MRNLFLFSDAHFLWLGIEILLSPIFFCFSLIPTYIVNRQANSDISILSTEKAAYVWLIMALHLRFERNELFF